MTGMLIRAGYRGISPSEKDLTYHRQKLQQNTNTCDSFYGCTVQKSRMGLLMSLLRFFLATMTKAKTKVRDKHELLNLDKIKIDCFDLKPVFWCYHLIMFVLNILWLILQP